MLSIRWAEDAKQDSCIIMIILSIVSGTEKQYIYVGVAAVGRQR